MTTNTSSPNRVSAWDEIRHLLYPWRGWIILIAGLVLASEALGAVPPLVLQRIVDLHLTPRLPQGILALALLYLGLMVLADGTRSGISYLTSWVAQHALRDLRVRLFSHLQRLPLSYYDRTPLGDVISRCTADVDTVDTLFATGASNLLLRLMQVVTTFVAMASLSLPLALVALLLIPPLAVMTRFFQVHIRDAQRARRKAVGLLNVYLQETLSGVEVVRAFGKEHTFLTRFRYALRDMVAAFWQAESYNLYYTPSLTVMVALSVALLLWSGTGGLGQAWGLSMGTMIAFILLFQRFFDPIRNLGEDWQTVQSALAGFERIVQVLQIPPEARPEGQAGPLDRDEEAMVQVERVTFGYLPGRPVLEDVTLHVRAGEHVALVGRTGAGKSSLVHLLGGLYAPWTGEIRVAGMDPRRLSDEQRRHVVAVVPQAVQLFSGTVWDNLTLGDPTASRDAVERAARMTGVDRFVAALPQGYETWLSGIGHGQGVQLSEGQRQLLSLARALVWDPAVLLLDEATAAVDNASEAEFRAALQAAIRGNDGRQRAAITVAHRLSTARTADRVILLEAGHIVEEGPPEMLIQQGGRFAALVELEEAGWDWRESV